MSSKGSDASCVPLCPEHHDQLDGRVLFPRHTFSGRLTPREQFESVYGVRLEYFVRALNERWKALTGKGVE